MPMIFAEKDKPLLIHEYNDTYGMWGRVGMLGCVCMGKSFFWHTVMCGYVNRMYLQFCTFYMRKGNKNTVNSNLNQK